LDEREYVLLVTFFVEVSAYAKNDNGNLLDGYG
jgi:hypothetical protein